MPELHHLLEINDPITFVTRKGTPEDPLKSRADSLLVMNGMITLLELPSPAHGVTIAGLTEIKQDVYEQRPFLQEHEFLVQYQTGAIQVHPSHEGTLKLCRYMGRGLIMYPASRIYTMVQRNPDIVHTLQDIVDEMHKRLNETQLAIERLEQVIRESEEATDTAKQAADNANIAADEANLAASRAKDAYKSTRLVFKEPVEDLLKLVDSYPFPEVGWTVQTYGDGKRYRYDGNRWIEIDIFGSNLQPVNALKDGLMSVAEHLKLKDIPLEVQDRVIVFTKESHVFEEIIKIPHPFPFSGEIIDVKAFCGVAGETDSEIDIEKSRDLQNWTSILKNKIHFKPKQHMDDQSKTIATRQVQAGDAFRMSIIKAGFDFQDLTIHIIIRT
ncbi:hypothetical protein D3C74_51370 [compost metagenome]